MLPADEAPALTAAQDKQQVLRAFAQTFSNRTRVAPPSQVINTHEELFQRWWSLPPGEERDTEFWTPKQVASHTRYSESRIRGLCDEGKLPYTKIGGRIYVYIPAVLNAFWRSQTTTTTILTDTPVSTGIHKAVCVELLSKGGKADGESIE